MTTKGKTVTMAPAAPAPAPAPTKVVKPGYLTTEFWITVLGEVGAVAAAASGVLPTKEAAILMSVSAVAYKLSRGLAKAG